MAHGTNRQPWEYGKRGAAIFASQPKVDIFRAYLADILTQHESDGWTEDDALTYLVERCMDEHKRR